MAEKRSAVVRDYFARVEAEHEQAEEAKAGAAIGINVRERCRGGDVVYKVT